MLLHLLSNLLKRVQNVLTKADNEALRRELGYCPNTVRFHGMTVIGYPSKIRIGDHSCFHNIEILGRGKVEIGKYCHFGTNIRILTQNHNYMSEVSIPYDNTNITKNTIIESFVWVGDNVLFAPGVHVGEGAIIGLGSVVSRDVPPGAIVAGNPIEVKKYRDSVVFARLKDQGRFY